MLINYYSNHIQGLLPHSHILEPGEEVECQLERMSCSERGVACMTRRVFLAPISAVLCGRNPSALELLYCCERWERRGQYGKRRHGK